LGQIKPEKVRLNLNIKGFFDKPLISLGTPEMLKGDGSTTTSPTNAAIDMAKQKGEELKNNALKAADSAKKQFQKEVEKKVDETKKQVEQEVEKKKNELMDGLRKKLPW
jgi:F0F1-type ATP synthase membrane subunit b/b'